MSHPYNQKPPNYAQGYGGQQQGYPTYQPQPQYGEAPQRSNSYGPPQHGGFQHGQAGGQYGDYDASNPQGQPGYYGSPLPPQDPRYRTPGGQPQNPYQNQYGGPEPAYGQQQHQQGYQQDANAGSNSNAPYDPNAPDPEGKRGVMGAIGGGILGRKAAKDHGVLGMIAGAIAGSKAENYFRHQKNNKPSGGSSWGGSNYGRRDGF